MNKLIVSILICCLSFNVAGQKKNKDCDPFPKVKVTKCGEHQIGVNLYSTPSNLKLYRPRGLNSDGDLMQAYSFGVSYKSFCGADGLRITLDYFQANFSVDESGKYYFMKNDGKMTIGEIRLGYERKLTRTKLQPYIAGDIIFDMAEFSGYSENYADFPGYVISESYHTRRTGLAFGPSVGLTYRPIDRLSITAETSVVLFFTDPSDTSFNNLYYSRYRNPNSWRHVPLRLLSVNYHF